MFMSGSHVIWVSNVHDANRCPRGGSRRPPARSIRHLPDTPFDKAHGASSNPHRQMATCVRTHPDHRGFTVDVGTAPLDRLAHCGSRLSGRPTLCREAPRARRSETQPRRHRAAGNDGPHGEAEIVTPDLLASTTSLHRGSGISQHDHRTDPVRSCRTDFPTASPTRMDIPARAESGPHGRRRSCCEADINSRIVSGVF